MIQMNTLIYKPGVTLVCLFFLLAISACNDSPALPDNLISFETNALGLEGDQVEIKLKTVRAVNKDVVVVVTLAPERLSYGTEFTTRPDGSSGVINLILPSGSSEAFFTVNKTSGMFLNGDENITFTITSSEGPVLPGVNILTKLSFAAITSEGAQIQLSGKTDMSPYANSVYVDLSANKQTPIDRKSWNLGFYNGDQFRVILNPGYQTTAAPLVKTDITTVVLADTDAVPNLNHDPSDPATVSLTDYWDGDLTKTAFAEVSATESENKVYLLSFEGNKNKDQWFKIKVNRNGNGYKVQYARAGEATINTIDVPKNAAYNFTFVSLEQKRIVSVEPGKANWDIEWSYSTSNSGMNTPYWFQDFVLLNYAGGAEAAEIVKPSATEAETAYSAFAEADLAAVTLVSKRDVIGSKWRATGGPSGGATGIRRDRFYIVKDPRGNVYKLKFVSMGLGSDGGERGRPVIEYKLVKKAG